MDIAISKVLLGVAVSTAVTLLPALGNVNALAAPQLWILWLFGVAASVLQPAYKPFETAPLEDRGTALQILWSIYVIALGAIIEAVYWRYPESFRFNEVSAIALTLMVLGLILRSWAVITLGEYFTWHITLRSGHRLIRQGPYRFLRHPAYAGALLSYCVGPLFLHAWVSVLMAVVLLPVAFVRRIRHEEALLLVGIPEEYEIYRREVRALIPWLW